MKNTLKLLVGSFFIFVCLFLYANNAYAAQSYTVHKGDTLGGIAKIHYGNASAWRTIYQANKTIIKNPNLIRTGWVLTIPDAKKRTEVKSSRSDNSKESSIEFKATAYDLSIESCGKSPDHPEYGITYSGRSIEGMTRQEAACVAVDTDIIPIGSLLLISFDDPEYEVYNNIYQALDTGSGVRDNHIDLFLGDFGSSRASPEVLRFGVTKAKVIVLRDGW
jgi:3D (Asp-Asp-Asp) domain-containing protein